MSKKIEKIEDLKPDELNANKGTERGYEELERSLRNYGAGRSILVDKNGNTIAGNKTLEKAMALGLDIVSVHTKGDKLVVVIRDDLDIESPQARELAIADNRTSELGLFWDDEVLKTLSDNGVNLSKFWTDDELAVLFEDNSNSDFVDVEPEIDKAEELCKKWGVKFGQLWQLGRHRLICGDCREIDVLNRLLNDEKIDQLVTDPPYGVDYSNKNKFLNKFDKGNRNQIPIENDDIFNYRQFFSEFISIIPFAVYNTIYIFMSGKELHNLRLAIEDCGCVWGDYLVWVKNNHVLGRKDYNSKREFILYGWKNKHKFYGDFSTNVLNFNKPLKSEWHPTMKPIELVSRLINDGSIKNAIVYDPFLGSGTTLIVCEQTDRKSRAIEIEPKYCAITIQRWVNLTGEEPKLVKN